MEAVLGFVRWFAFASGTALFGVPLFALYTGVAPPRLRLILALASGATALAAVAALIIVTGQMAGDGRAGLDLDTLSDVISTSGFGFSILARLAAALAVIAAALTLRTDKVFSAVSASMGAISLGALAWAGHGAADDGVEGLIHTLADIAHLLAAGVWLGALLAFLVLLGSAKPNEPTATSGLHAALHGFSGIGAAVVAVIVASGLINSWFLVGARHLDQVITTPWGQLLLAKLAAFVCMLVLAALNRFRLTPALGAFRGDHPAAELTALRRSIALEMALGLAALALVAALGMLPPPIAA